MTRREALTAHRQTCQECRRVERGESPVCSPRFVLEVLAGEGEPETTKEEEIYHVA